MLGPRSLEQARSSASVSLSCLFQCVSCCTRLRLFFHPHLFRQYTVLRLLHYNSSPPLYCMESLLK